MGRMAVGNKGVVLEGGMHHPLDVGDTVEIVKDERDHQPYLVESVSNGARGWLEEPQIKPQEHDENHPKFAGDFIKFTELGEDSADICIGKYYELVNILNIDGDIEPEFRGESGDVHCVIDGDEYAYYEKETKQNVKRGDKIRITEAYWLNDEYHRAGDVHTVKSVVDKPIGGGGVYVRVEGIPHLIFEYEFEVVTVNEYVKVIADNYEHRVGDILELIPFERALRAFDEKTRNVTTGAIGFISRKNVELATDEEVQKATPCKVGEIRAGDIVHTPL